jgi:hypothetical protein
VIFHSELGSFRAEVTGATFEFGFCAGIPEVCPHSVVAPKAILITATQHALVKLSRMVCEMDSCIKVLESLIAANLLAVQAGCF